MNEPAPINVSLDGKGTYVRHPAWIEWFQRVFDYYRATLKPVEVPGLVITATSDFELTFSYTGSDGVTRSGSIMLL